MPLEKREKCPDCYQCQMCAERRCVKCRKGGHAKKVPELATGFTHGEYLAWKQRKQEEALKENSAKDNNRRDTCPGIG